MAKHRKGRQAQRISSHTRRPKSASGTNHWVWLMAGMLMGILGITAIFLFVTGKWPLDNLKNNLSQASFIRNSNMLVSNTTPKKDKKNIAKPKKTKVVQKAQKKETPRFEFYQLLPGMEVPLPEPTTTTTSAKTPPKPTPNLATTEKKLAAAQYLIQAGTFRSLVNAESLKKRLGLKGLTPQIQKIEAEDGVWYRVTLGPFASEALALNQKALLAKEKIPGILILQRQ